VGTECKLLFVSAAHFIDSVLHLRANIFFVAIILTAREQGSAEFVPFKLCGFLFEEYAQLVIAPVSAPRVRTVEQPQTLKTRESALPAPRPASVIRLPWESSIVILGVALRTLTGQ